MVWVTNNVAFLDRSAQVWSSMLNVAMLSMNPYIDVSFALMSSDSVSTGTSGHEAGG